MGFHILLALEDFDSSLYDSPLVCKTFSYSLVVSWTYSLVVPWTPYSRWRNFKVYNIYREMNHYANLLTNLEIENKLDFLCHSTMPLKFFS